MISVLLSIVLFFSTNTNKAFEDMDSQTELLKASRSIFNNDFKTAIRYITNAVLYQPKKTKNKVVIGIAYSFIDKHKEAFKFLEGINEDRAKFYKYYNLYKGFKFKVFKNNYKKIISGLIDSKLDEAKYMFIATTLWDVDKKLSLLFFKKAIKLNKNILSIKYLINPVKDIITEIYSNKNNEFKPSKEYYNSQARLYNKLRDSEKAKELLNISIKNYKNNPRAKKILAHSYILEKNYKEALKLLNEIKQNFVREEDTYLYYIEIYNNILKDKKKELLKLCKDAKFYILDSNQIKFCVAKTSYELGLYDKTYEELQYILKSKINNPDANILMAKTIKKIMEEIDRQAYEGALSIDRANKLKKEYNRQEIINYIGRALEQRPYDFDIIKMFYKEYLKINIDDIESLKKLKINSEQLSYIMDEKESYERRMFEEEKIIKFNKLFTSYLKNKNEKTLKEMKYLDMAKIIMLYLEYLNSNDEKKLMEFLSKFSKRYIELMKKPYAMNQKLYSKKFEDARVLEFSRVFDFIVSSYF